ncbi:hypothetical protein [Seonamhaeicola sp.]|uniref:hypothetical protein n=1 Tax=Seonamhaeicola sp. TaxID=1912245 RepID=UPI0026349371|nr:hypothetical protein [Seonamhaeicola sp.]
MLSVKANEETLKTKDIVNRMVKLLFVYKLWLTRNIVKYQKGINNRLKARPFRVSGDSCMSFKYDIN